MQDIFPSMNQKVICYFNQSSYFTTGKDGKTGSLKSKGMSQESIKSPSTARISFKPQ